jgi:hypothetical protein
MRLIHLFFKYGKGQILASRGQMEQSSSTQVIEYYTYLKKKKVKRYPCNRLWRPIGL